MNLILPEDGSLGFKVPEALVKKLNRKFSLTSEANLDDAVCLANYLFALGEVDQARELLESFVFKVESREDRRDIWGAVGFGLILLAHIYKELDPHKTTSILTMLDEDDIYTSEVTRYENFLMCHEDHQKNMDYGFSETPKYKCEVIGQEALTFLYFYEMMPVTQEELPEGFADTLSALIDKCYGHLRQALEESRLKVKKPSGANRVPDASFVKQEDAVLLYSGQLGIDYGQFYVDELAPQGPGDEDYLAPDQAFANQVNGLCGAAQDGKLFLVAGPQTGVIQIDVVLHSVRPDVGEGFEDVVECSLRVSSPEVGLCSWAHEETHKLALSPGDYRVRYSITGMDRDYADTDEDVDTPVPGQKHLLQFWPEPPASDDIVRVGSEGAAYWHGANGMK